MNRIPEPIEDHETLWFEMYADRELNPDQIEHLFGYLDAQDGIGQDASADSAWKKMALTLVRERLIAQDVSDLFGETRTREPIKSVNNHVASPKNPLGLSERHSWINAALVPIVTFVLGMLSLFGYQHLSSTTSVQPLNPEELALVANTSGEFESFDRGSLFLDGIHRNKIAHTIFEIEDTPTTATYYLSKSIPKLLLQSLVLAGHSVEVGQESIALPTETGENVSVPISTLHIKKFAKRL